jgi:hypothetical protein
MARYRLMAPHFLTRSNGIPALLEKGVEVDSIEMMPGWEPTPHMIPLDGEGEAAYTTMIRRVIAANGPHITGIGHVRNLHRGVEHLEATGWGDTV